MPVVFPGGLRVVFFAFGCLALCAFAQDPEGYARVAPSALAKPAEHAGRPIVVEVQFDYATRFGTSIEVVGSDLRFLVAPAPLAAELDRLGDGEVKNCDVWGRLVRSSGDWVFNVEGLRKLPEDLERLQASRLALAADDVDGLTALLAHWRDRVDRLGLADPALLAEIEELPLEILHARERSLRREPAAIESWLALARDVHDQYSDREWARRLGRTCLEIEPDNAAATAFLRELCYVEYRGEWLFADEYRLLLGFELYSASEGEEPAWVPSSRIPFLKAVASHRAKSYVSKRNDALDYGQLAGRGQVELGMHKDEVLAAVGFPLEVDFLRSDERNLELWEFGAIQVYLCSEPGDTVEVDPTAQVFRLVRDGKVIE